MENSKRALPRVHTALAADELTAIQRLRYEVYIRELQLPLPGVDHAHQMLCDSLDASALHLYFGATAKPEGAARINWNEVPRGLEAALEIDRLPRPFAYCSRFCVRENRRGGVAMRSLTLACFAEFHHQRAAVAICHCYPHLRRLYERLGFRPYGTEFMIPGLEHLGLQTPLRCPLAAPQSHRFAA
jgi:predicted GNAT family N-acyltransferase